MLDCQKITKITLLLARGLREQKGRFFFKWLTHLQLRQKHLFQAFNAISGSSSAGEGCIDTNALWK